MNTLQFAFGFATMANMVMRLSVVTRMVIALCLGMVLQLQLAAPALACADDAVKSRESALVVQQVVEDAHSSPLNGGKDDEAKMADDTVKPPHAKSQTKPDADTSRTEFKAGSKAGSKEIATASIRPRFDMDALIARLKESDAIGMFTKLALRSDALDLMDLVNTWKHKAKKISLQEVRSRYDGLVLKVLALLDDDPALSGDISSAREEIWQSLLEVKT
ncbi:MAG: hypothetical protein Q9M30_01225 [Mariprofundaceae bacterium]|nr:hypothetical protein [Mariprofundaceae bacterium]